MTGIDGITEPAPAVTKDGVAFISAPMTVDSTTQAGFDTVDRLRKAVHAVPGADALVRATRPSTIDTRRPRAATTR